MNGFPPNLICLILDNRSLRQFVFALVSAPTLGVGITIITLLLMPGFSIWYLDEQIKRIHIAGFILITVATMLIF